MSSVRPVLEITIRLTPDCLGANPAAYNKYIYYSHTSPYFKLRKLYLNICLDP